MKKIFYSILSIILLTVCALPAAAQDEMQPLKGSEKKNALKAITAGYSDWGMAEISGKIAVDGLPIKASFKLWMKKSSAMMLSVRAPFLGELARIEADTDSLLLVNKRGRTYCKEAIATFAETAGINLLDIQDFFLGRVFIAGSGTLTQRDAKYTDIYAQEEGWLVIPSVPDDAIATYGFLAGSDGHTETLMLYSELLNAQAQLDYTYGRNGSTSLDVAAERGKKKLHFLLEYGAPKWGASPMESFTPDSGYRRTGIKEFMRSMKL